MPAPLNVDREAVRTLAIAVGVREAARQMNLPEPTLQTWSRRGHWFTKPALAPTMQAPLNPVNPKPAVALANALADESKSTRLSLSRASAKAAQHLAQSEPEAILKRSRAMVDVAKTAGVVHGWDQARSGTGGVNINVLAGQASFEYKSQD